MKKKKCARRRQCGHAPRCSRSPLRGSRRRARSPSHPRRRAAPPADTPRRASLLLERRAGAYDSLLRLRPACEFMVVTSRQHVIQEPTLEWLEEHFPEVGAARAVCSAGCVSALCLCLRITDARFAGGALSRGACVLSL